MNFVIEIKAPELAKAVTALAAALSGNRVLNAEPFGQSDTPVSVQPEPQQHQVQQIAPVQQPPTQQAPMQQAPVQQPPIQQAPVQQAPVQQQVVPTSAPGYTMDQLAVAATQLMDAGKRADLLQLLASFGVNALTALPKEQYGAFATKLREMGAKI